MKLKGGVIIIGSLAWDDHLDRKASDNLRKAWRKQYLSDTATVTKVPIRYGRESEKRGDTYTMIFSKSCEDSLGQGLIRPFNSDIISFEGLQLQAIALAGAEGIYKKGNLRLTSSWGSIGLLINPNLIEKDFASKELIQKNWSDIYYTYNATFIAANYKMSDEEISPITDKGFLNINWQEEMKDYDILLATPVVPKPKFFLSSFDIAKRMIDKHNQEYFQKNLEYSIKTFQDGEILINLNNLKN